MTLTVFIRVRYSGLGSFIDMQESMMRMPVFTDASELLFLQFWVSWKPQI